LSRTIVRLASRPALPYIGLAAVPLVVTAVFLGLGAGYVLDDWWLRANARFDGTWSVGGEHTGQRPLAVPLWVLAYDTWAGRPVPALVLQGIGGAVFAVCLALLLRRVMAERTAIAVAATWAVLPTHLSLEVWLSCIGLVWSQAAAAAGLVVGWRDDRRWWHLAAAAACFAFAVLAYEANVVVAAIAVVLLPWVRSGRPDWRLVGVVGASSSASMLWVAAHWFEGKEPGAVAPVQDVFAANVAWAFTNPGPVARGLTAVAAVVFAVAVGRLLLPSFRRSAGTAEWLMVVGVGVMAAGTVPFAFFVYEPIGAGDRMNGLSAVGGALFLVGLACLLARAARPLAVVAVAAGLTAATVTRADRLQLWSLAGTDADAIVEATVAAVPRPEGLIVLGPEPVVRWKVLAFLERSSIESALELAYDDRDVRAVLTQNEQRFLSTPGYARIDIRPISALDDHN
jgi:hypothetical protein